MSNYRDMTESEYFDYIMDSGTFDEPLEQTLYDDLVVIPQIAIDHSQDKKGE
jgi:hypothetical protein